MEKVNVMGKIALFTQRVARPIKFAAFISIVVSVVVMFAACQGAVGKAGGEGADGPRGPQGPKGDPGDPGDPGVSALIATGGTHVIRVNDKVVVDGQTSNVEAADDAEDVPADFDVSELFRGGTGDLTFEATGAVTIDGANTTPDDDSFYTIEVSEAGMASLARRDMAPDTEGFQPEDFPAGDGGNLVTFIVTAMDENDLEATKTITVQRNIAPVHNASPNIDAINVGLQDAANESEDDTVTDLRPRLNQYVFTVAVMDTGGDHFTDAESSKLTVEAESSDAAASVAIDKQTIVITGHTEKAGVTITMRVVDAGGLKSNGIDFTVNTVAGPAAEGTIGPQTYDRSADVGNLVNNINAFFKPDGIADEMITAESSDPTKILIPEAATDQVASGHLRGTPRNQGSATITVKATDAIGQYATQTFTATVVNP